MLYDMDPPTKPEDSDCCNSGCNPCILDVYDSQLKAYERYLSGNLTNLHISKTTLRNVICQTSYAKFKFVAKKQITADVFLYTFYTETTDNNVSLQYKNGQHFMLRGCLSNSRNNSLRDDETKYFTRPLTPVRIPSEFEKLLPSLKLKNRGLHFQILVKILKNGKMSNYLQKLQQNDWTYWRGPYGNFDYETYKQTNKFDHLICFTQGVGIAPVFTIIDSIVKDQDDFTTLHLNCCFKNVENILLRSEIFDLKQYWNFKYNIYLSQESCTCFTQCNCFKNKLKYSEPILNHRLTSEEMSLLIKDNPLVDIFVLICGSNKFSAKIQQFLIEVGIKENKIHVF